jgi:hypothetical protein
VKKKVDLASKPVNKLPFEQAFPAWFAQFAEEDDARKMGGEGIEKLFEEMDVGMDGVSCFLLSLFDFL